MKPRIGKSLELVLWIGYVALPFFTGWLDYRPMPNELFDENRHEVIESHAIHGPNYMGIEGIADKWRDPATGQVYSAESFAEHRRTEALRLGVAWFAYGVIGCALYSCGSLLRGKAPMLRSFAYALALDVTVALAVYFVV